MRHRSGVIFSLELMGSIASAVVAILTVALRDWIEFAFHVDPDRHNGSVEWLLAASFLGATILLASLARREWRHSDFGRTQVPEL